MFDVYAVPPGWGLCPVLFGMPAYAVFVTLGLAAGTVCYFAGTKRAHIGMEPAAIVLLAVLLGAGFGAKLPVLLLHFSAVTASPAAFFTGKTVLGGFAGGLLGAVAAKKLFHIQAPFGDAAAPAAALGLALGRLGCLLAGCCFGRVAGWGVDFGDGLTRLPTQLFEVFFHAAAFAALCILRAGGRARGVLLERYLFAYLIFRYFTEFSRESEALWAGQTLYQLICIGGILLMLVYALYRRDLSPKSRAGEEGAST